MTKKIIGIDLTGFKSSDTTSLELIHPLTGDPTGIVFVGHTPDSKEWRQAARKINGAEKPQVMKLEKKGSSIELDKDAGAKKRKIVIAVITEIRQVNEVEGLEDVIENNPETIKSMLAEPTLEWMLEDWTEHLDDRSNFFQK